MIFLDVKGGLGNQMFQYALYEKLKKCYGNDNVKLHIGYFKEIKVHNGYELDRVFSIKEGEDFSTAVMPLMDAKKNFLSRVRRRLFGFKKSYFFEAVDFSFKKDVLLLDPEEDVYLDGYWQSEKYFYDIRQELLNIFKFSSIEDEENSRTMNLMNESNSVSIHIRRGDYVNNEVLGGVCDVDYYNRAISNMVEYSNNPYFFVFSDDIKWVKKNLSILTQYKVEYIDRNRGLNSYIDMQLMSCCKNNIIPNSTFSWWGAWLNQNENKKVIAPKIWLRTKYENRDIIPDGWIKI